jgi:hypothetical protein
MDQTIDQENVQEDPGPAPEGVEFSIDPQELQRMASDLKTMTPEDLFLLRSNLGDLERAVEAGPLPELGGVAWSKIVSESGAFINLTGRGVNATLALQNFLQAVWWLRRKYPEHDWHLERNLDRVKHEEMIRAVRYGENSASRPAAIGLAGGGQASGGLTAAMPGPSSPGLIGSSDPAGHDAQAGEWIEVSSYSLELTKEKKIPYLRVKGGRFNKWGLSAYAEVIPEPSKSAFATSLKEGEWHPASKVPPNMRWMFTTDGKKVARFAETLSQ